MRRIACIGLLAIGACLDPVAYPCTSLMQCSVDGKDGSCHGSGWCVYPDDGCPSGQRFGPAAGDGLADDCADPEVDGETGASTSASESTASDPCGGCDTPPSPCHAAEGVCDPATSTCEYEVLDAGMPCDDDDPCTLATTCDSLHECVPEDTIVCNEPPSPCHTNPGTCDADGMCIYELLPVGSECDDGSDCTIGTCSTLSVCEPGPECVQADTCATGVCTDGECVFTPVPDGMSCGVNVSDRCCGGACVDISADEAHCGGCGTTCASDETCESVADTPECDPHPVATSGRCTCTGDNCDLGQTCRGVTPVANRCAPVDGMQCASGVFQNVENCPNYCIYGTE